MLKKARRKARIFIERKALATAKFIASTRPARWIARRWTVRLAVGILVVAWDVFAWRIWRPVRRLVRQIRRFLGRREVWVWLAAWMLCAGWAWLILATVGEDRWLPPYFLRIAGGLVGAVALLVVSLRSPLAGLLFWLVASPLLATYIRFKLMPGTPVITGDRICIAILLLVYAVSGRGRATEERNPALHWSMFLFIAAMLVACIPTERPRTTTQEVLDCYLVPILAYFFARRWITDKKRLSLVFGILMFVGVYFCAIGIPEHFLGHTILRYTNPAWMELGLGTVRVQGPAGSPSEFGLVVAAALMLAIVGLACDRRKGRPLLHILVMAIAFTGIILTLRRSVYFGTLLGLLAMLAANRPVRKSVITILAIGGIVLLLLWKPFTSSKVYTERLSAMGPIYQRAVIQATAWNVIKHHPVFGIGFGNFGEVRGRYIVSYKDISALYARELISPHNSYLRILVEGGLLAFIPFACMVVLLVLTSFRIYKRARGTGLLGRDGVVVFWGLTAGVLGQAMQEDQFYHSPYLSMVWLFYLGALAGVHCRESAEEVPAVSVSTARSGLRGRSMGGRVAAFDR